MTASRSYVVIRGFHFFWPLHNEVPLYRLFWSLFSCSGGQLTNDIWPRFKNHPKCKQLAALISDKPTYTLKNEFNNQKFPNAVGAPTLLHLLLFRPVCSLVQSGVILLTTHSIGRLWVCKHPLSTGTGSILELRANLLDYLSKLKAKTIISTACIT